MNAKTQSFQLYLILPNFSFKRETNYFHHLNDEFSTNVKPNRISLSKERARAKRSLDSTRSKSITFSSSARDQIESKEAPILLRGALKIIFAKPKHGGAQYRLCSCRHQPGVVRANIITSIISRSSVGERDSSKNMVTRARHFRPVERKRYASCRDRSLFRFARIEFRRPTVPSSKPLPSLLVCCAIWKMEILSRQRLSLISRGEKYFFFFFFSPLTREPVICDAKFLIKSSESPRFRWFSPQRGGASSSSSNYCTSLLDQVSSSCQTSVKFSREILGR